MKVNFFDAKCKASTNEIKFGLFDPEGNMPATLIFEAEPSWNAVVINHNSKWVEFTAIDKCIVILKNDGQTESSCDCMLNCESTLFLVELKNKRNSWQSEGLGQIEATIQKLIENETEYYYNFSKRKAIVANSKYQFPHFQEINIEQREYFWQKYRIRIQFESEIKV